MASNRYTISKGNPEEQKPGSWWRALRGRVFIRCPECKMPTQMGTDADGHAVNVGGEVHPSVECPTKGCTFHRYVRLEGWAGDADE